MTQVNKRFPIALLITILFTFILFVAFLLVLHKYQQTDLNIYYTYSLNIIQGKFPYTDFEVEYPPLALLPMLLPQLPSLFRQESLQQYIILFFIQNAIFSYLIGITLYGHISTLQPQRQTLKMLVVYAGLIAVNLTIIFCRYDIFAALLTLLAFWSIVENRSLQSGIWLGLGIAAKLYPVVLLPVFCLFYFIKHQYQNALKVLLGCLVTASIVLLPFALAASDKFFYFLTYHKLRGLHIETLPGGLLLLLDRLGLINIQFALNYGAYHLASPIANPILKILPELTLILFALIILLCFNHFRYEYRATREISSRSLVTYIVLTLLVFIISAKVFSAQYLVWLLPFLVFLPLKRTYLVLIISIAIANMLVYPFLYSRLLNLQLLPLLVLNTRNLLMIVLTTYLVLLQFPRLNRYKAAIESRKSYQTSLIE